MKPYLSVLSVIFIYFFPVLDARAVPSVTKISDTVVDFQALTFGLGNRINGVSFQQDAVVTENGWQYVTYYNAARHVCVARRQLPSGSWQNLELPDYTMYGDDAHDVISMGICPHDGTIHLTFDHHGDALHYRVSQTGVTTEPADVTWDAVLFSSVRNYLEVGKTVSGLTYPRFIQTPAGNLQFRYRLGSSGSGNSYQADYSGATSTWSNTRQVISRVGTFTDQYNTSTARNGYLNGLHYDPQGRLHTTWCWRESTGIPNHDIMYAWSPDGGTTWFNGVPAKILNIKTGVSSGRPQSLLALKNNDGVGRIGLATGDTSTQILITLDSPGVTAVDISRYYGLMNQQSQAVDAQGRIHTVMWHCSDASYAYAASLGYTTTGGWGHATARRYHHYWRDHDGVWHHYEMPWISGNRPKLFIRANGDAFLIYRAPPDPIAMGYGTRFSGGDLTIAAATADSGWTDWRIIHTEPGPFNNDMLGDPYRFKKEEILSVFAQDNPTYNHEPTPLRILDFQLN